jgi:hypothetical protein
LSAGTEDGGARILKGKVEIWNYEHSSLRRRDPKLCLTQRERIKESKGTMNNVPVDK